MKGIFKKILSLIYVYFLGVVLSWAAFPLLILLTFIVKLRITLSIYTAFSSLVLFVLIYINVFEEGKKDKRLKGDTKAHLGFLYSFLSFLIIYLIELFMIFLADRFMLVEHPFFAISNLNSYIRLAIYMPFYWLYQLVDPYADLLVRVNLFTALIPGLFIVLTGGFAYMMAINDKNFINIDLQKIKKKLIFKNNNQE